ncbi:MAG: O-succinylhomoserine sulfhydrylase [Magnetospiraceae bacterium]
MSKDARKWRPATQAVRGGTVRSQHKETSEALYLNSGYVYDEALEAEEAFAGDQVRFVYSRFGNPTVAMLEERLALIEGTRFCRTAPTGMAAIFAAIMAMTRTGGRVVGARALFGSCVHILNHILPRFGVETEMVDGTDNAAWERALSKPTDCVLLETPSNPTLELVDLKTVCSLAEGAGAKVIVDNVFATPILQRPMEFGAHTVVYSATKYIDGQGRVMGGAILTDDEQWVTDELIPFMRNTGPTLAPFNAWVLLKGLETMEMRVRKHSENALAVARFLETLPGVERVLYPGLESHPQHDLAARQMDAGGPMVSFDLVGGKAGAYSFLDALEIIDISNNLGDVKSLITHPATTTHQKLTAEEQLAVGINPGTVRFSVGLEDAEDLKEDLAQAVAAATG